MTAFQEKRRELLGSLFRDEVSRVASDILRREGFNGLTIDRIANEVGVSRGTLYNYFADADSVLIFIEEQAFKPVHDAIVRIASNSQPALTKLSDIATVLIDALNQDRALALALFSKRETRGKRAEHKMKIRTFLTDSVQQIIRDGADTQQFRKVPTPMAAECFFGSLGGIIDTMLYNGELRPPEDFVPQLMDVLFNGLRPNPTPSY